MEIEKNKLIKMYPIQLFEKIPKSKLTNKGTFGFFFRKGRYVKISRDIYQNKNQIQKRSFLKNCSFFFAWRREWHNWSTANLHSSAFYFNHGGMKNIHIFFFWRKIIYTHFFVGSTSAKRKWYHKMNVVSASAKRKWYHKMSLLSL